MLLDGTKDLTSSKSFPEMSPDYPLSTAIISTVCVVIIAVVIGFFVIRMKQRREKFGCEDVEIHPFFEDPGAAAHFHFLYKD